MAVILWIWCKSSEEKILQWAGCRNVSASALWDTFYDLETLRYGVGKEARRKGGREEGRKEGRKEGDAFSAV
jgi:hypothetical protein